MCKIEKQQLQQIEQDLAPFVDPFTEAFRFVVTKFERIELQLNCFLNLIHMVRQHNDCEKIHKLLSIPLPNGKRLIHPTLYHIGIMHWIMLKIQEAEKIVKKANNLDLLQAYTNIHMLQRHVEQLIEAQEHYTNFAKALSLCEEINAWLPEQLRSIYLPISQTQAHNKLNNVSAPDVNKKSSKQPASIFLSTKTDFHTLYATSISDTLEHLGDKFIREIKLVGEKDLKTLKTMAKEIQLSKDLKEKSKVYKNNMLKADTFSKIEDLEKKWRTNLPGNLQMFFDTLNNLLNFWGKNYANSTYSQFEACSYLNKQLSSDNNIYKQRCDSFAIDEIATQITDISQIGMASVTNNELKPIETVCLALGFLTGERRRETLIYEEQADQSIHKSLSYP